MSDIIGKPISRGPQAVNFVFWEDVNTILVDLSGAIPGSNTKRRSTGLEKVTNTIYRDPVDKSLYNLDVSGTDVSSGKLADYKLKFFFANNDGLIDLSYNSPSNFSVPMPNLIDLAFSDASGNPYYTKYQSIYGDGFEQDISLFRFDVSGALTQTDLSNQFINKFSLTQEKTNFLDISLSAFDASENAMTNPVVDISLCLGTNYLFKTVPTSDVSANDVFGNFKINFNPFGVSDLSVNLISNYSATNTIFKIPVNTLVPGAKLSITGNTAQVQANVNNGYYPKPTTVVSGLFKTEYTITKSGPSILEIPITIPANTAGSWVWNMKLTSTVNNLPIVSTTKILNVAVLKSFNAPVVSSIDNLSSLTTNSKLIVRLADVDYNEDISKGLVTNNNKLSYALRLVPQPYYDISDSELNDISNCFSIKRNGNPTNLIDVLYDVSNFQLSQSNITTQDISLSLLGSDLSKNTGSTIWTKSKTADVSDNYIFDLSATNINRLRERNYNVAIDWMNYYDRNNASNNTVNTIVQNLTVDTPFPGQVNVQFDKGSGTIALSSTNGQGINSSCKYNVRIYTDSTLRTIATASDLAWQTSTKALNTFVTQNAGVNEYNFDVKIGTNFMSNVYLPKQISTKKLYLVAYVKDSASLIHYYTHSSTIQLTELNTVELNTSFYTQTFRDVCQNIISEPILFQDDPTLDPSTVLDNSNLSPVPVDISGYIITSLSQATDLSFNILRPSWWKDIVNPSLTVSLNDPNGIVDSFDISGARIKKSDKQSITTVDQYDLSNNFFIDLSFNKLANDSFFRLNFVFTDDNKTSYPKASKSILIFYNAQEIAKRNTGAISNTFVTYNDIKFTLNNAIGVTPVNNLVVDGFGTFPWVAGSANNMYNLNLARSEFMGEDNHILDLSGMTINATRQDCSGTQVFAYFAVTDGAGKLDTSANIINTTPVGDVKHIVGRFLSYPHSYLYIKKFIGTIDIQYTTVNKYLKSSANLNTLKIVVLPRPTPIIETIFVPAVNLNTPSNFNLNITNIQRDTANMYDLSFNNWSVSSIYSRDSNKNGKLLGSKIASMTNLSNGVFAINPLGSDNLFVKPSISSFVLSYGTPNKINSVMKFVGKPTVGSFTQTLNLSMNRFDSKLLSDSKNFTVTVFNGSTFSENMFTKNATINSLVNFAGFDFVVYKTIDNSTTAEELDLINHSSTKNAAFIVITNNASSTITVSGSISISVSTTVVIKRDNQNTFSSVYIKK